MHALPLFYTLRICGEQINALSLVVLFQTGVVRIQRSERSQSPALAIYVLATKCKPAANRDRLSLFYTGAISNCLDTSGVLISTLIVNFNLISQTNFSLLMQIYVQHSKQGQIDFKVLEYLCPLQVNVPSICLNIYLHEEIITCVLCVS